MPWNKAKAIEYLRTHAQRASAGRCAEYTRKSIEAGGLVLARTNLAKDYGPSLTAAGFVELLFCPAEFEEGDVVVMAGARPEDAGHMAMFDGINWVSDFVQRDLYPGPGYRAATPDYAIYRYPA